MSQNYPWHDGQPVVVLFRNGFQAQLALDNLLNIGLPESDVALIRRDDAEVAEAMRKAETNPAGAASVDSGVGGTLVGGRQRHSRRPRQRRRPRERGTGLRTARPGGRRAAGGPLPRPLRQDPPHPRELRRDRAVAVGSPTSRSRRVAGEGVSQPTLPIRGRAWLARSERRLRGGPGLSHVICRSGYGTIVSLSF